jgi:hypothetical protein
VSKSSEPPDNKSGSKKLISFLEHGDMPPEVAEGVESAITAIKTQPRTMMDRIRKSRKNGRKKES